MNRSWLGRVGVSWLVVGRVDIMEKRHPGGEDSLSKAQRGGNEIHCYPCPWLTLVGAESTHRKKKLEKKNKSTMVFAEGNWGRGVPRREIAPLSQV